MAVDLLRLLTRNIDSRKKAGYARIEKQLIDFEREIDEKTHHEIAKELADWDGKLRDLRKEIHNAPDVTDSQRESLLVRYRALEFEIESSPKWVSRSAIAQVQSKAAPGAKPSAMPGSPAG